MGPSWGNLLRSSSRSLSWIWGRVIGKGTEKAREGKETERERERGGAWKLEGSLRYWLYRGIDAPALKLKCTKFDFRWASRRNPLGELTAFPRPLTVVLLSVGEEKRKERRGRKRKGSGKGAKGTEGEGKWSRVLPPLQFLTVAHKTERNGTSICTQPAYRYIKGHFDWL